MGISRADADELWELITAYASDWATPKGTVPPSWMPSFVALSAFVDSLTVEPPTPAETTEAKQLARVWDWIRVLVAFADDEAKSKFQPREAQILARVFAGKLRDLLPVAVPSGPGEETP